MGLIINADDLGRTAGINSGIFQAHRQGVVTSATLMVNYPASPLAAAELPAVPGLGVGLHVALTGGVPTLPAEQVSSLVDEHGRLPAKPEDFEALSASQVLAEVRAQLAKFQAMTGGLPTHLDGHHHCHRLPEVFSALVTVAVEHKLPVRMVSPEMRQALERAGVPTTDSFENSFYGPGATLENLLALLDNLPAGVTEVMCHPARVDDELRGGSGYSEERERELEVLTHPQVRSQVAALGIPSIHFGDLLAGCDEPVHPVSSRCQ
ncbi:MAG: ChbG/HpnK family deacetylase [Deltaproteobacteria bacterium]|nr:ChbG/HpnK family deacetylase [Deltaproteobacteria bacterium]